MLRPLRLLNLTLGLVVLMIAVALAKTWVSPATSVSDSSVAKPSQELAAVAFSPTARPALAQFDVVLEKNPFKQPAPQPPPLARPGPPQAPPLPLPTLVGTVLVDDERWAILSDKGKANIYSIGQEVAGGTLTAIREDRVLFKRGDAASEITLKAPIQAGVAPPQPGAQPPPPPPPAGAVVPSPVTPPQAIEGAPTSKEAPLSRAERRRLRLLQQQGQVEPSRETEE